MIQKKQKREEPKKESFKVELKTPMEIKSYLDENIIGQTYAKTALSVAVYNHYKSIMSEEDKDGIKLEKSNLLLLGPTGSGKTFLIQTIAKKLKVPFVLADAMAYSETGFKGNEVSQLIVELYESANKDLEAAQRGIIYIDEIDKITCEGSRDDATYKAHAGVQRCFLRTFEGTKVQVDKEDYFRGRGKVYLDTTNVLFICGGAFVGLEDIVRKRLSEKVIGFSGWERKTCTASDYELLRMVQPGDLSSFGLIPEFIGRLHMLVPFEKLDVNALERILTEPTNALLKQYKKRLAMDGIDLIFTPDAVHLIAQHAFERGTGARGLRAFMEKLLLKVMFRAPSYKEKVRKIIITPEYIEEQESPFYDENAL